MSSAVIVRLSSLGDIAQALPLAGLLDREGWRVGWTVERRFAGLVDAAVWPVQQLSWSRGLHGLRRIRGAARGFDVSLDVQGNWKSGVVAAALGADRVLGLAREDVRERGNLLFTDVRAAPARAPHVLDRSLTVVAQALGRPVSRAELPRPPWLRADVGRLAAVRTQLAAIGLDPQRPLVAITVGRPDDPRTWPLAHARELQRQVAGSFLVTGPREYELALDGPVLRQGGGDLRDLVALGAVVARSGGVAVGHDHGAMHVLHATGARCLFLFGPQDPARTGPAFGRALVGPDPLECRPCLSRRCAHELGPVCMSGISPALVAAELREPLR